MSHKTLLILLISFSFSLPLWAQFPDSIFTNAERMPYFPGCTAYSVQSKERKECSDEAVKTYIFNHIIYPQAAKDANIEGAVYVRFIVDEMGYVRQPQLLKDIGGGCGDAALSMLTNMPQWEPAFHKGHPVKVALELPIHFYFKENGVNTATGYKLVWGQLNDYQVSKKALKKNLNQAVSVFNTDGITMTISELQFSYGKNKKVSRKASNGKVTSAMEKMVKKLKRGGLFSIMATVQKDGQFIEVVKEFSIQ
ncbi:MAG: energy transducer TonB [Saprospiraceae bacterium]